MSTAVHKKYKKQKIDTYVSVEDINRLKSICKKYGYNSIYELLKYLVHCFLRVADPENDPIDELVPDEIREMFISPKEYKRLKKKKQGFEIQLLIPYTEFKTNKVMKVSITDEGMSEEIIEMFSNNSDWEKSNHSIGSHTGMVKKQKTDQRKIKTANDL